MTTSADELWDDPDDEDTTLDDTDGDERLPTTEEAAEGERAD